MAEYENPMQSIGYINQDFQTIYPQLLDLTKELTDKWDPSQSNESDPLVVLIKEMAIIADKLHYALNKEGLENFPESVTQLANARELFDQGGYTMQWYIGATGEVYLRWIDTEAEGETFTIPIFTMLSDEDADKIYTTTRQVVLDKSGVISEPVEIIQGTVHDYEINGNGLITPQNLDEENRLYFRDYNIAENGIFIRNDGSEDWFAWKAVDNLYTYKYGEKIFKFGVLQDNSTCYIEFPEYAGDIIGGGIHIKYILTDGSNGNIKANTLVQFYDGAEATYADENNNEKTIALNTDNVSVIQNSSILTGYDPESISSAYKNFKKTAGTFNTLVSLIDYNDYLNLEGVQADLLSNGFTTDRTNDIQNSFYIVTTENNVQVKKLVVEPDDSSEDSIQPFELKLYLLKYAGNFETLVTVRDLLQLYTTSFSFLNNILRYQGDDSTAYNPDDNATYISIAGSSQEVLVDGSLLEDVKCVSNYFTRPEANKILFLKNVYPLNITIVPTQTLSEEQKGSVKFNVLKALCQGLNSKNVSFGQEINYDEVFDIIKNADGRIRTLFLDDLTYITYAVYFDEELGYDPSNPRVKEIEISDEYDYIPLKRNGDIDVVKDPSYVGYEKNIGDLGIVVTGDGDTYQLGDILIVGDSGDWSLYSNKRNDFRTEIFAKSVLAGKTQFLVPASPFKTSLSQTGDGESASDFVKSDIKSIDTHFDLYMKLSDVPVSYTLAENEGIYLTAPNLITEKTIYGARYVCQLNNTVSAGTNYRLGLKESLDPEYIILIYKTDDSNNYYNFIVYRGDSENNGPIISADIKLNPDVGTAESLGINVSNYANGTGGTLSEDIVKNIRNYFTTSQGFYLKKVNKVFLIGNGEEDGQKAKFDSLYCYWILNDRSDGKCVLFDVKEDDEGTKLTYTLKSGEYFLYTTSRFDEMVILGSGTKIEMTPTEIGANSEQWSVGYVSEEQVAYDGISAIPKEDWKLVTSGITSKFVVTEMQIISLAEGDSIQITGDRGAQNVLKIENDIKELNTMVVTSTGFTADLGTGKMYLNGSVGFKSTDWNNNNNTFQFDAGSITGLTTGNVAVLDTNGSYMDGVSVSDVSQVSDSTNVQVTVTVGSGKSITDGSIYLSGTEDERAYIQGTDGKKFYSFGKVKDIVYNLVGVDKALVTSLNYSFFGDNTLNSLDISGNVITWGISSILLADLSPDTPQKLSLSGLTVNEVDPPAQPDPSDCTLSDGSTVGKIDYFNCYPTSGNSYWVYPAENDLNLLSNFIVTSDRKEGIDTHRLTGSGTKYLSLYKFTSNTPTTSLSYSYTQGNDSYTIQGSGAGGTFTLSTSLPSVEGAYYLIPYSTTDGVTISCTYCYETTGDGNRKDYYTGFSNVGIVKVGSSEQTLGTDYSFSGGTVSFTTAPSNGSSVQITGTLPDIADGSTYKNLKIPAESFSGDDLQFSINGVEGQWTVTIGSVFCYKPFTDTNFGTQDWNNVLTEIAELDTESIFDFTYEVDEDVLIKNPLKSKSFIDPNHVYNQYTICECDLGKIFDEDKGSVKILNRNRG